MDPSVPLMLGIKETPEVTNNKIQPIVAEGVKVISMGFFYEQSQQAGIYRGPIVSGIVKQFLTDVNWGELDYLIIDLPPGTGDAPLTLAQTIPITGISDRNHASRSRYERCRQGSRYVQQTKCAYRRCDRKHESFALSSLYNIFNIWQGRRTEGKRSVQYTIYRRYSPVSAYYGR